MLIHWVTPRACHLSRNTSQLWWLNCLLQPLQVRGISLIDAGTELWNRYPQAVIVDDPMSLLQNELLQRLSVSLVWHLCSLPRHPFLSDSLDESTHDVPHSHRALVQHTCVWARFLQSLLLRVATERQNACLTSQRKFIQPASCLLPRRSERWTQKQPADAGSDAHNGPMAIQR